MIMKHYIKSEIIKFSHQKLFLLSFVLYLACCVFIVFQAKRGAFLSQYKFFSTITILFLSLYQILSIGEWQEKKIIHHYLEYIPNRIKLLCFIYGEYVSIYLVVNLVFLSLKYSSLGIVMHQLLVYPIIFLLYIAINMNLLIYFEKVGVTMILSFILLWILPNLINIILSQTSVYSFQIFYYLSPDSFTAFTPVTCIIALMYIVMFFLLSLLQFTKKEY
ncbi:hypothetical protein HMPREF1580_00047 [Gardnerella vaginalis JCP8070]|nr:hypothetical protein HMPREF1580_00047 [Gardnerella vaginalis JCP8070]